jgi:L-asparaginase/Glu-tRNA(Gln) amidotransferase subunit D
MLDSGDITDEIRANILKSVQRSKARSILIIHGTNTMT